MISVSTFRLHGLGVPGAKSHDKEPGGFPARHIVNSEDQVPLQRWQEHTVAVTISEEILLTLQRGTKVLVPIRG
ncbi:hypothetical protein PAXRUDRAFT_828427 [Paxillus rubicundulus Ve08.2h10]|uniref:Uncharacterized protein n=1 Tax=Paxillus rubicundulus Ve08.2h10 TaxID=930991 RepID=A0A0D0DA83_9AGAM|nr:hypothetical protein PAXRUDRAFT_828427 [Paxillus rubicundulus Ve08.2h10]